MKIGAGAVPLFADLDHDRILQVLSNLIGNSLKFTPNGGTIELSARKQETHVEVSVTDNGPGISAEAQARIFERFSQLNVADHQGLGLGLFITKWIVEAHKGRIWVTSIPRNGCTVSFTLPFSPHVALQWLILHPAAGSLLPVFETSTSSFFGPTLAYALCMDAERTRDGA